MSEEPPAIAFKDLTRDFPIGLRGYKLRALEKVSFNIPAKGIYGLLGPNGSGKSTSIKIILGLLSPSSGRCEVFGVKAGSQQSKKKLGYLPENPHFPSFLTGKELVEYFAGLSEISGKLAKKNSEEVIQLVGMENAANRKVRTYSKGMLQRIGLAQALVHNPDILILDEPLSGLDPEGTQEVIDVLMELRNKGKTILISSHLLSRVEEVCDRVAILHKGRLIKEGNLMDLIEDKSKTTSIQISGFQSKETLESVTRFLERENLEVQSIDTIKRPLDEVFIEILKKDRELHQ